MYTLCTVYMLYICDGWRESAAHGRFLCNAFEVALKRAVFVIVDDNRKTSKTSWQQSKQSSWASKPVLSSLPPS